jgi:hypothetical protein
VTRLIRVSPRSLNNWDCEKWGEFRSFGRGWSRFFWSNFGKAVQRRGVHVNIPEIGSRDGEFSFGGIWGFCAELRREYNWGNFILVFFRVLLGVPRGGCEEGGPFSVSLCAFGGILFEELLCEWGGLGSE